MNKNKIPDIPPLLVNNKLLSDFYKKAELFNRHFAEQCTLVQNTSTLPVFNFKTNNRLKSFDINENDLHLIIKNLNANKAHGWDDISIRMIQLCGKSIALPLKLLFKTILEEGTFPEDCKKSNVVPINKKESKNLTKNYRPISLLPIFSKILGRLIFNSKFNFLDKIIFSQSVNLVLFQETPVLLNYYQLPMKFTKVLIAAQREMLRGCVKYLVD